ncbi:MAG: hypothetical protein HC884_09070 [Chloroflexaceae bacterium]|nr:hypothetical protein [Chloroflexaceae bacterium]
MFRWVVSCCLLRWLILLVWTNVSVSLVVARPAYLAEEPPQMNPSCSAIILAGVVDGNWEILAIDLTRRRILNLTQSSTDEHAPSLSPDGRWVAFSAHSNQNWDIYILNLERGELRRLTSDPAYDGAPAWSPDGSHLAFESNRLGNLDIFIVPVGGGEVLRVTSDAQADIEPVWSPDGEALVFSSWRSGNRQLYQILLKSEHVMALSLPGDEARQPAFSPDGAYMAYTVTRHANAHILVSERDRGTLRFVSKATRHMEWPFWEYVDQGRKPQGEPALLALRLDGGGAYTHPSEWALVLHPMTRSHRAPQTSSQYRGTLPGLQWQHPVCVSLELLQSKRGWQPFSQIHTSSFVRSQGEGMSTLPEVQALQPRLSAEVVGSYQRLREQTLRASGRDFLDTLYDAWRGLDHPENTYISWHTAGRAIDVRDWYQQRNERILYTTRQNLSGYTYFRIYLRTLQQDGSQGKPLRESLWETDRNLPGAPPFDDAAVRQSPPLDGYFVDFTDLAEREGWTRISALEPPDGDWSQDYMGLEFWHYERRDGLTWYQAMQRIYSKAQLQNRFTPRQALEHGYTIKQVLQAGLPGASQLLISSMNCLLTVNDGATRSSAEVSCQPTSSISSTVTKTIAKSCIPH